MSSDLPQNELSAFHLFLGRQLEVGGDLSPEESVREYRAYQEEAKRLNEQIQSSIDSGEAKPLDREALMKRVQSRLAEKGIVE